MQTMPFRVGRRTDASLCLSHGSVSSRHAEFVVENGALLLSDLQSTNGTFVNGKRIFGQIEIHADNLVQFADMPFRVVQQATEDSSRTIREDVYERAWGLVQFDKLLTQRALISYFQPVIRLADQQTVGYEILSRSRLAGLETPAAMFLAAAQLNCEVELSRLMRTEGIRTSALFPEPPHVFVNTHPMELESEGLLETMRTLRRLAGSQKITVEIHEAAVTNPSQLKDLRTGLIELDIQLAFDDFGAGQGRLCELAEVQPDYLKFDRQMIQEIHRASLKRQQMVAHLVRLVAALGIIPLAEGVECREEGAVCREMGFALAQGYYYGRPAPVEAHTLDATVVS